MKYIHICEWYINSTYRKLTIPTGKNINSFFHLIFHQCHTNFTTYFALLIISVSVVTCIHKICIPIHISHSARYMFYLSSSSMEPKSGVTTTFASTVPRLQQCFCAVFIAITSWAHIDFVPGDTCTINKTTLLSNSIIKVKW